MTTATITSGIVKRPRVGISALLAGYNKFALAATALVILFMAYLMLPHVGILHTAFRMSLVYLIVIPTAGLTLAIISLRQVTKTHEKGKLLSYIALGITSLYFVTGLAIPFVLLGTYLLYTYVL